MIKGFYLLFDLKVPNDEFPSSARHFRIKLANTEIVVKTIYLIREKKKSTSRKGDLIDGRFIFWFKDGQRDDLKAQKISDALLANFELIYQIPFVPSDQHPLYIWLDKIILYKNCFLNAKQFNEEYPRQAYRLNRSATYPSSVVKDAWNILPITLNQPYFDAIHFYQASIREYCFIGDGVSEVINGYLTPVSRIDLVRGENAVINAFKAIEAIIGDPPKDKSKLRKKLMVLGIDPDELVGGFTDYSSMVRPEPLIDKIYKFNALRDKKAAHGRSAINREISYFEIMDLQYFAQTLIIHAINFQKKQQ